MGRIGAPAVIITVAALGLASVCGGLAVAVLGFAPVPFGDALSFLHKFYEAGGWDGYGVADLYRRHNEHRVVLPSLWFLADLRLFAGTQAFLVVVSILSALLHAGLLVWLFRRLGHGGAALIAFAAVAGGAALSPAQWENLVWGFQVQFIQVWLFASLAFAALAVGRGGRGVAAAILFGLASTYTMANGLLAWPLLAGLALWLGRRGRGVWAVAAVGAAVIAVEVAGFRPHPTHSDPAQTALQPLAVVHYALRYLTAGVAGIGPVARDLLGAAAILTVLAMAVDALRRRGRYRAEHGVLLAVAGFAIGAGMLTALGRVGFGLAQADASRYATPSLVFLVAVLALVADRVLRSAPRAALPALAGGGALLLLPGLATAWIELPLIVGNRDSRVAAIVDWIAGGYRPSAMLALYPRLLQRPIRVVERLEREGLGPFALRERFTPPPAALREPVPVPSETCRGFVDGALSDPVTGVVVRGWATERDGLDQPEWVVVRDAGGAVVAWGASLVWRPDVAAALETRWGGRGFTATGPTAATGPFTVTGVFEDGRRCRIGMPVLPAPPRFLADLPAEARPAGGTGWVVSEGGDQETGPRAGIPAAVEPAVGVDPLQVSRFAASFDLRMPEGRADLLVPVRTGDYPLGAHVVLVDPGSGATLDRHDFGRPSAGRWSWLVLHASEADGRMLRLQASAERGRIHQGLAVGQPYWRPVEPRR